MEGNEKADEVARDAGENGGSEAGELPEHLRRRIVTNPTAAKRTFREGMGRRWRDEIRNSPRRERMEALDPDYPSMKFFEKAIELALPRRQFATLVQMRLGHYPTADYLYRFKIVDSPECPECGTRAQTPIHILMGCDAYIEERAERDRALRAASRSYRTLLTPGPATRALMEYLQEAGFLRGGGEGRR